MQKARRILACAVAAAACLATAPSASAAGWFDFTRISNTGSRLVWKWNINEAVYSSGTWRAGSGTSTACGEIGRGWLPLGWYDTWGHWNGYPYKIKGRVFYLQNKRCPDGTLRTELFIHTEETSSNGQYCPTSGDDPYCWEGWFDYYSNGCIKVSYPNAGYPNDIGYAHWYYHNRYGSSSHGSYTLSHRLYVHT